MCLVNVNASLFANIHVALVNVICRIKKAFNSFNMEITILGQSSNRSARIMSIFQET